MRANATATIEQQNAHEPAGLQSSIELVPQIRQEPAIDLLPVEPRLTSVRRFVTEAAEQAGLPTARIFDLTLAASEACANAIEHGQGDDYLCVSVRREEGALRVEVISPGSFDLNVSRRRAPYDRGLGLPLMVALADEVTFTRLEEGGTKVCLTVRL